MTGKQSTITDALKNHLEQRVKWLLNGPYQVIKGSERGRSFIKRIRENSNKEDPQQKLARCLKE